MTHLHLIGNWKMNGSREAIAEFAEQWSVPMSEALQVAVAVPHPYLQLLSQSLPQVALAAQDCAPEEKGAHTGQVSAGMLVDWGCQFVIIGHSERRSDQGETDALIAEKIQAAQRVGLTAVLCVGESHAAREAGDHKTIVSSQLQAVLAGVDASRLLVAYEPIWAIGTGLTASPAQVEEMHAVIKGELASLCGNETVVPVLYGGSVTADNARSLFDCAGVDGALVGGASLSAASFSEITQAGLAQLQA
jgi:triosephosphate isomerase